MSSGQHELLHVKKQGAPRSLSQTPAFSQGSLYQVTQFWWFPLELGAYMSMRIHIITLFPMLSTTHRRYPEGDFLDKESTLSVSFHGLQSEISTKRPRHEKYNRYNRSCRALMDTEYSHMCSRAPDVFFERHPGSNLDPGFILNFSVHFLLQSLSAALTPMFV